ncbi:MAG: histidinol-phosphate transaminase [Cyanobacteria bacterium P01_D01_bin.1]
MSFLRADLAQFTAYQSPHLADDSALVQPAVDPLDTNESPIDLPDEIKAALAEKYQGAIAANRYPDGAHFALKQAVLKYALSSGATSSSAIDPETLTPGHITLGNGSDELIRSVLMATCLGNNGSILVATPTFSMYAILAKTLGITVHSVPRKTDQQDNFTVDTAAAQTALQQARHSEKTAPIKVVFMVHPNSPTGNALTAGELDWLRQLPEDVLVVVDEAYFEFSGQTTLVEALSRPNWIILRTFSKAFRLAAHRVGYGIAHPDIISALEKLRLPYNLPSFSQAAAITALAHSDQLLAQVPVLLSERDKLLSALEKQPALRVWPSDGNFIYARLCDRALAHLEVQSQTEGLTKVCRMLRNQGTLVRHTGGGLRISIGTAAENQRTLSNLQQVLGD